MTTERFAIAEGGSHALAAGPAAGLAEKAAPTRATHARLARIVEVFGGADWLQLVFQWRNCS